MSPAASHLAWYRLDFPGSLDAEGAVAFVRSLAGRGRAGWVAPTNPLVFELRGDRHGVRFLVGLPESEARRLRGSMESWLPGLSVQLSPEAHGAAGLAVELRLRSQRRSLRSELQPEVTRGLLASVAGLRGGELVVVQWTLGGWLPRSPLPPASEQGQPPTVWNFFEWGTPRLNAEEITEARKKQSEQLFACAGRVAVRAASAKRRRSLVSRVVGAYQVLRVSGAGFSRRSLPSWWVSRRMDGASVNQIDPPSVLRADELVAVLGWPVGLADDAALPGVELSQARLLRPDRRVLRPVGLERQRIVAESGYPSLPGNLVLDLSSAMRHLHVIGPTGVGKSTLLAHLIAQDIEAGIGVVVVDPKGDLVDDTVTRLGREALDRVVMLDPSDEAPVGLNPLSSGGNGVAVDGVLGVLHSLWASSWGPRLHDVLHAGLLTLSHEPGHSLVELPLLLTNPSFRRPLVAAARQRDPLGLGGFWAWYDSLSAEAAAQVLGPVMNKLRAFLLRPDLRAVLGQPRPRFDLRSVFTHRAGGQRALLVRLPKGELGGEAAALLGSLVVHQVWQATLARTKLPARARRPVVVYLDEFQEVVRLQLDLGDALAQARGLCVGLVLAHQHLGQLGPDLRAGVLANAGSRVAFRLDHEDASVIAKRSGGRLKPEDFAALPAFDAYADLVAEDAARGFASARTRPLGRTVRSLDSVRRSNRRVWGTPRAETEAHLRALLDQSSKDTSGPTGGAAEQFGVLPPAGEPS